MGRGWSKYINVAKYNAKRNLPTLVDNTESYSSCTSNFIMNATGFANAEDLGKMEVTYYVSFHRPNLNLN